MSHERTGTPRLRLLRLAPLPGEIGHPGTCPLCASGRDTLDGSADPSAPRLRAAAPPCLACRDELRARLLEMSPLTMSELAMN